MPSQATARPKPRYAPTLMRAVRMTPLLNHPAYVVTIYDAHEMTGPHHSKVLVTLHREGDAAPIFALGDTWIGVPGHESIDSDDSLRSAIDCVTMKPGDTDEDFFADYTKVQLAFAESHACETMQCDASEPDEDYPVDDRYLPWVEVDDATLERLEDEAEAWFARVR